MGMKDKRKHCNFEKAELRKKWAEERKVKPSEKTQKEIRMKFTKYKEKRAKAVKKAREQKEKKAKEAVKEKANKVKIKKLELKTKAEKKKVEMDKKSNARDEKRL